jgi:mRNA interferase MazF
VQANEFNESRIQTVIVAAMTSNLRLAEAPGNVLCRTRETKLPKDSVVNVSQLLTMDKSLLTERITVLPTGTFRKVEDGLRLVLNL